MLVSLKIHLKIPKLSGNKLNSMAMHNNPAMLVHVRFASFLSLPAYTLVSFSRLAVPSACVRVIRCFFSFSIWPPYRWGQHCQDRWAVRENGTFELCGRVGPLSCAGGLDHQTNYITKKNITQKSHHKQIKSILLFKCWLAYFPTKMEDDQIKSNLVIQMLVTLFNFNFNSSFNRNGSLVSLHARFLFIYLFFNQL